MYIYRKTASRGVSASRSSAESSHAEDLRDSDPLVETHISPTPLSRGLWPHLRRIQVFMMIQRQESHIILIFCKPADRNTQTGALF